MFGLANKKYDILEGEYSKEYFVVFDILKNSLFGLPFEVSSSIRWDIVLTIMKRHTVLGHLNIKNASFILPKDLKIEWKDLTISQLFHHGQIVSTQQIVQKILDDEHISSIILKGSSAAKYYPRPEQRAMGDIDILVPEKHHEKAIRLLIDNGYSQQTESEAETERHVELIKNGIEIELHKRLTRPHNMTSPEKVESYFDKGIDKRIKNQYMNNNFWSFPDFENGLSLLYHIYLHLNKGIGLRQIVDWMMFVNQCLDDCAWEHTFKSILIDLKLDSLAICLTRMCQKYLGLTESIQWCSSANERDCYDLMNYILGCGNFGENREKNSAITGNISLNHPVELFHRLQDSGIRSSNFLQNNRFLQPFAWLYALVRRTKNIINQRIPIIKLINEYSDSSFRKKLFLRLRLPY